ncbi:sensor histidine kinase [Litchfieldia alkalitelluris]|uniref:sensor histidine kinase n=1 Tax=Litchfieldia alkalitelluris TaxID=304268 RepID=UPI0009985F06|nr:sensor histidine kinase [Litchfieldia alkalitelluris]
MPYDLAETPGGFYAVAYLMSALLFAVLNKGKRTKIESFLITLSFLALIFIYMEIINTDVHMMFFVPSILVSIGIIYLYIYLMCDLSLLSVGYYTARAFIVGEFIASFSYQIYYFAVLDLEMSFTYFTTYLFIFISYSVVLAFMYLLEKRFVKNHSTHDVTAREMFSAFIIVAVVFTMSNISYVYQNTPFSGSMARDIFNIRTLVDFGGVALLFAYHIQINEMNMKFEVEKLQNLLRLQIANYELSEKSIELVNQKYHDLKHQIAVLKQDASTQEAVDYLEQMEDDIKIYEAQNKTGNKVLDTVLMGKQLHCQDVNVTLTVVAEGKALDFMDPVDISTLFGNILDNAIESVVKIDDIEKRLIHLTISKRKSFLSVRVENCYEGKLIFNNGLPVTTKKDKNFHGYGLKSIQQTVKKYDGTMTIKTEDGWFELRILFPLL